MREFTLGLMAALCPVWVCAQQFLADWSRIWGSATNDSARAMVRDSAGNLYIAGYTYGAFGGQTNAGDADLCLVKYTAAGSQDWVRIWGSTHHDEGCAVALDATTNIYVAGLIGGDFEMLPVAGGSDLALFRFGPGGVRDWVRIWGSTNDDAAYALALDSRTNIYVAGFAGGAVEGQPAYGGTDICLTKFDPDAGLQWLRLRGGTGGDEQGGKGVGLDAGTNIYVAGYTTGPFDAEPFTGARGGCLVKFNAGGTQVWTRIFDATNAEAAGVDVDRFGNVFVTGHATAFGGASGVGGADAFLLKYWPNGICGSTSLWGSTGDDYGYAVKVCGDLYVDVAGAAASGVAFDGVAGTGALFVTRAYTAGGDRWSFRWGASNAAARAVGNDGANGIFAAGDTIGGFAGQSAVGWQDGFLSRLIWHDGQPPFILTGPIATNITASAATIRWTTDKLSDSRVQYGPNWHSFTNYRQDAAWVTDHELRLTNLVSSHGYNYQVRSTDMAGSNVTSAAAYFVTRDSRPPSYFVTSMVRVVSLANLVPQFMTGISNEPRRLDFEMNGRRIGTAYDAPYSLPLLPFYQRRNLSDYYGSNLVQLVAHAGDTATTCIVNWDFFENCDDGRVEVTIFSPWNRCVVLTPTNVALSTNILLEAQARKKEFVADPMIPGLPPGRSGWHEEWTDVDEVRFYVDNTRVTNTLLQRPAEWLYYCRYDVVGLATGRHVFAAEARLTNGCVRRVTRAFTVEPRAVELEFSRAITRITNYFRVAVSLHNVGNSDVRISHFNDVLVGLQLMTNVRASVTGATVSATHTAHYEPSGRKMNLGVEFTPAATVGPGKSLVVEYGAVPILDPLNTHVDQAFGVTGSVRYVFGGATNTVEMNTGAAAVWSPADGTTGTVAAAVRAASTNSDYLIVTGPHQLFALNESNSVDRLLRHAAELAARRRGVLAYQNAYWVVPTMLRPPRQAVVANFIDNAAAEVILPDFEDGLMRAYNMNGQKMVDSGSTSGLWPFAIPFICDLRDGDRVAAGNWVRTIPYSAAAHDLAEIIVVRGNAHTNPGYVAFYQYDSSSNLFWVTTTNVPFTSGCGFLAGNYDMDTPGGGVTGSGDELLIAFPTTGIIRIFSRFRVGLFASAYDPGDLLASGDITGYYYDDIVIGDMASGQIMIYCSPIGADGYGYRTAIPYSLEPGDQLAVANVWGDARAEILIADQSAHRAVAYAYFPLTADYRQVGVMRDVLFQSNDLFVAGNKYEDGYAELVFLRHDGGNMEVCPFGSGESIGNARTLDQLLNQGGAWANQMATNWVNEGYLLILGETSIIPAFSGAYTLSGERNRVRVMDRDYARTRSDELDYPNLTVGRMIGNTADELLTPVLNSIQQADGRWRFYNTNITVALSGYDKGPDDDSDNIDFWGNSSAINHLLADQGFRTAHYATDRGVPRINETNFADYICTRAFCYLAGHGNWNVWDVVDSDDVLLRYQDLTIIRPVIYADSCLTGYYVPGTSLAEAFLQKGVAAYIGNTETAVEYNRVYTPIERFIRRMGGDKPIAKALRNAKQAQYGSGGSSTRPYRRYDCAICHFYGDPKLNYIWEGYPTRGGAAARAAVSGSFTGPVASLQLTLPGYEVLHTNGVDFVTIPGESGTGEPGRPNVPIYGVTVSFPPHYTVRDINLQYRGGINSSTGLVIPACVPAIAGRRAPAATCGADDPWWPQSDYEWLVARNPDDSTTLEMTLFPFYYNSNTTAATYYSNYIFFIEYVYTPIRIANLFMERSRYDVGGAMRAELWVYNTNDIGCDVVLAAAILSNGAALAESLPLRVLDDLAGIACCAIEWDSAAHGAGEYTLEVELMDLNGAVYDRASLPFTIGEVSGLVTNLAIAPKTFYQGDCVGITAGFENDGDLNLSGILYIQVLNDDGSLIEQFQQDFSNLVAGGSTTLGVTWTNAGIPRGNCRIVAFAQYNGDTTPLRDQSVPPADLMFVGTNSVVGTPAGPVIRWPSVGGRTYTVMALTNLVLSQGAPLATGLPAAPPYNAVTDAVERATTVYKVIESW